MDFEDVASKRASENALNSMGYKRDDKANKFSSKRRSSDDGVTSADKIKGSYKTAITKTPGIDEEGFTFMIQTIVPGNFIGMVGLPVFQMLADEDIDLGDPDSIKDGLDKINHEKATEILSDESFDNMMRSIVCAGVIKPKIVDKPQYECEANEVSINQLPMEDFTLLFKEIMVLSVPKELADKFFLSEETS